MLELQNVSRRRMLGAGLGFGSVALHAMLQRELRAETSGSVINGQPQITPKAKSVIWLFMRGGVSHLESFDPKPALNKYAGQSISESPFKFVQESEKLKRVRVVVVNDANGQQRNKLFPLQIGFQQRGESGLDFSDWFPHLGGCADDIAVVRSMWTTDDNHGAQIQFHSGRHTLDGRFPTIGAWVKWGLASLNDNLPQFITMGPRYFDTRDGHYLGPAFDAVPMKVDPAHPLPWSRPELDVSSAEQDSTFDLVARLNRLSANRYQNDSELRARLKSYELAYRMQRSIPDVIRFDGETQETQNLYGLDNAETKPFGMQLLAARRLVERGVRFIQIMHGDGAAGAWDAHSNLTSNHSKLCGQVDRPIAGLLRDLKRRGLLNETIVVFATEFGRTPGSQGANGRDHHPYGFSVWLAGGGIRGGIAHGTTDEIGFHADEHPHYVTDIHATLLHQLGLHPESLEVPSHKRLVEEFGTPIHEIIT